MKKFNVCWLKSLMFVDFALKCLGASLRDVSHPKRLFYNSLLLSQSFITLYYF